MVAREGVEPTRTSVHEILSLERLPASPPGHYLHLRNSAKAFKTFIIASIKSGSPRLKIIITVRHIGMVLNRVIGIEILGLQFTLGLLLSFSIFSFP